MKKNFFILADLMAISLLISTAHAQNNNPPTPSIPSPSSVPSSPSIPPPPDFPYDKAPTVVKRVDPAYPPTMLSSGWEATVYMKAFINVDGSVLEAKSEKIQVTANNIIIDINDKSARQKTDGKAFEEASYNAVKQWKFSPAQMHGKPVGVWITIPFRFKIYKDEKKQPEDNTSQSEMYKSMLKSVEHILKGYDLKTVKRFINPEAYLIYGKYYESLQGVLNGEHNKIKLIEGSDSKVIYSHFTMSDDKTTGYTILKTQIKKGGPTRFHTIVFMKNETGDWQIKHWQVSF